MKRIFYITAFMFLGFLLATLLHALIEIPLLAYLTQNLASSPNHILWQQWPLIHALGGGGLWFGGIWLGFVLGRHWWQILYVERRYGTPKW